MLWLKGKSMVSFCFDFKDLMSCLSQPSWPLNLDLPNWCQGFICLVPQSRASGPPLSRGHVPSPQTPSCTCETHIQVVSFLDSTRKERVLGGPTNYQNDPTLHLAGQGPGCLLPMSGHAAQPWDAVSLLGQEQPLLPRGTWGGKIGHQSLLTISWTSWITGKAESLGEEYPFPSTVCKASLPVSLNLFQ
jgi:hypothetical protein